jgi:hypothetical protein
MHRGYPAGVYRPSQEVSVSLPWVCEVGVLGFFTVRVPKTCATWAKALQSAVEHLACAGPVLARPEVG